MNVLAEFDFSLIIYLLVGIFWVFSNLAQGKQAKKKAAAMKRQREENEREERRTGKKVPAAPPIPKPRNDLETFLRGLSEQLNPSPPPPPPIPKRAVVQPEIQFNGTPPAPPTAKLNAQPLANLPEKAKPSKSYDIGDLDMEASFKQISDMKEAVELVEGGIDQRLQQEALKNVRSMMIDLSSSSISVPSVQLQTIRAIRTETPRPKLRSRKTFKKALVASVILEAPKALREDPFKEIT